MKTPALIERDTTSSIRGKFFTPLPMTIIDSCDDDDRDDPPLRHLVMPMSPRDKPG